MLSALLYLGTSGCLIDVPGSLLPHLEGPVTVLIAVGVMRECLGRREMFGRPPSMLGGALVSVQPSDAGGVRLE